MNPIRYILDKRYRQKCNEEFGDELAHGTDYEYSEREKIERAAVRESYKQKEK